LGSAADMSHGLWPAALCSHGRGSWLAWANGNNSGHTARTSRQVDLQSRMQAYHHPTYPH